MCGRSAADFTNWLHGGPVESCWSVRPRPAKSAWPEVVGSGRQAHGPLRGLHYALRGARVARWMMRHDDASWGM